jgi:hypothetical protein
MTVEIKQMKKDNYTEKDDLLHPVHDKVDKIVKSLDKKLRWRNYKIKKSLNNYRNQLKKTLCHPCRRISRPVLFKEEKKRKIIKPILTKELAEFFREWQFSHDQMKAYLPIVETVIEEVPVYLECKGCQVFELKQKITGITGRKKRIRQIKDSEGKVVKEQIIKKDPYRTIFYLKKRIAELEEKVDDLAGTIVMDLYTVEEVNEAFEKLADEFDRESGIPDELIPISETGLPDDLDNFQSTVSELPVRKTDNLIRGPPEREIEEEEDDHV